MNISSSPLSWLLESLELDSSLFHIGRYCGQWQASTSGLGRAAFHLVVKNSCWLHHEGSPPVELKTGDAVFLLRDRPYRLSDSADPQTARCTPYVPMQPLPGDDGTGLVCGFFHLRSGLTRLILDALPDHLVLRGDDPAQAPARQLFELILAECRRPQGPSNAVLERLSQLLLLYVLREQTVHEESFSGLLGLARQAPFNRLLEQLIARPGHAWSLAEMAEICGLSRSALFKRVQELSGTSPGNILLSLRVHQACRLLQQGQPVAQVAEAVGYQSVAAFTRAFAKVTGVLPGAYRKQYANA